MISILEAAEQGILRIRKPIWANPMDHILITIFEDEPGPWLKLYAPYNLAIDGEHPVTLLITAFSIEEQDWERYTGPLPDSDEYREMAESMAVSMAEDLGR